MSSVPYNYVVDYKDDILHALHTLREQVFQSGKYHGAEQGYKSISDLMANVSETGTRSILDIVTIGSEPDFCSATLVTDEELEYYFGTAKPKMDVAENIFSFGEFWEDIGRGQAKYMIIYDADDRPMKIMFAGYSFD